MKLILPKDLLSLIGSFWKRIVSNPFLNERIIGGLLGAHYQSEEKASSLVKSASNLEIPAGEVFTFEKFIFVLDSFAKFEYGADLQVKYGFTYLYGSNSNNNVIYDIPNDIISIPTLYDNPARPTKTYTENIDYKITNGKLEFKIPMSSSTVLYARKVIRDTGFTYRNLAYVLGLNLSDSLFTKVPLAELWRLFSYGPNYYNVMRLISLCARAPIAKHDNEVVQGVGYTSEGALVITNRECYFIPIDQAVTVEVNQVLKQGDPVSSGIEILHYANPTPTLKVPSFMVSGENIKYGNKLLNPSRVIIIKANVSGPEVVALQYFTNVLPLDSKIILLANKSVLAAQVSNIQPEATKIANSVLAPKYANNLLTITPKCTSSLKYSLYGF
jgi:hypothetical protein